jgi:hypothetical protein
MVAVPPPGRARLSSVGKVVVWLAPSGPRKPVTRPSPTSKPKPSTAVMFRYRLVGWPMAIIAAVLSDHVPMRLFRSK